MILAIVLPLVSTRGAYIWCVAASAVCLVGWLVLWSTWQPGNYDMFLYALRGPLMVLPVVVLAGLALWKGTRLPATGRSEDAQP